MSDWLIYFPMLIMGLFGSLHCVGMCGGIMGALTMAVPSNFKYKRWVILCSYNVGRIFSYALMGFLAGIFAQHFFALGGGSLLRIIAGLLLIAMGLYLADWWRGLRYLEHLGRYLWAYVQPLGKFLLPVTNAPKALLLGMLWGWLPCGLIYSALALAMTQPSPWISSGAMLAFGIGTLPAVLAVGVTAQYFTKLLQQRQLRLLMALLIIVYGVWTLYAVTVHTEHHKHHEVVPDAANVGEAPLHQHHQ